MYVTKPLSVYRRSPQLLSLPPPEGPNSGYLVLHDDESVEINCCGCEDNVVRGLPFPQNKDLTVGYGSDDDAVAFIPVLNQPLSSNQYHVIRRRGRHQGEACTNTREEDTDIGCCGGKSIPNAKPKPLDPSDIYQQFRIHPKEMGSSRFFAKSVDPDGFPPYFLRRKGWSVRMSTLDRNQLGEASGLNSSLRASLPRFDFPLSHDYSEVVCVGKWYCPFMFVKEGGVKLKDQMKYSMYYEIKLEQRWEKIFDSVNENAEGKKNPAVFVDAFVQREVVYVGGQEAVWDERNEGAGDVFVWFKSFHGVGGETSVGLSMKIFERMKWEQERVGWVDGDERQVRVERVEEFGGKGGGGWKRFSCFVLLRSRLPDFNFPLSLTSSNPVVVGKWYCPFVFVKEGTPKDQMSRTRFFEMTLEQRWEQIFACEEGNAVVVDVFVENESVAVGGNAEAVHEEMYVGNGVMWYMGLDNVRVN
ncbi:hypothetical protein DVH24_040536 [Malus domestica]|uniref:Uncharacterized protein n=1 Tax=Malus domestica TaxID=3750 RepID=A0A498I8Z7_MALDO|nr:hypothetical protein DVH24_040536 [Malus domestica]